MLFSLAYDPVKVLIFCQNFQTNVISTLLVFVLYNCSHCILNSAQQHRKSIDSPPSQPHADHHSALPLIQFRSAVYSPIPQKNSQDHRTPPSTIIPNSFPKSTPPPCPTLPNHPEELKRPPIFYFKRSHRHETVVPFSIVPRSVHVAW